MAQRRQPVASTSLHPFQLKNASIRFDAAADAAAHATAVAALHGALDHAANAASAPAFDAAPDASAAAALVGAARSTITTPARALCAGSLRARARSLRAARGAREAPSAVGGASSQPPRGVCCLFLMNSPLAIHKTNNPPLFCYQTTGGLLSDHRGFVFNRLKTNLPWFVIGPSRGLL